jgi:hypothetical protein
MSCCERTCRITFACQRALGLSFIPMRRRLNMQHCVARRHWAPIQCNPCTGGVPIMGDGVDCSQVVRQSRAGPASLASHRSHSSIHRILREGRKSALTHNRSSSKINLRPLHSWEANTPLPKPVNVTRKDLANCPILSLN